MNELAIETVAVRKIYGSAMRRSPIVAIDGVDLSVLRGEVFGLLGPNGAGKTTTVKVLLDLTHPTSGHASILSIDVRKPESRKRVGYLPEGHRFPGYLTARETLSIFGRMSGLDSATLRKRIPILLERVRLSSWIDVRVKKFSKGMTQRLGLAAALVHDPDVLLLDEPTDGVDPVGRREIRDLLKEEARNGKTVFLNSHLLSEIELTCDRVAVLRSGKVVAAGSIAEMTRGEPRYRLVAEGIDQSLRERFAEIGAGIEQQNGHYLVSIRDVDHLNAVIDRIRGAGAKIVELSPVRSTLEDVFVDLVKPQDSTEGVS